VYVDYYFFVWFAGCECDWGWSRGFVARVIAGGKVTIPVGVA